MAERTYIGVIEQGAGGYGIIFPDFPGCVSAGDSLDHVLAMGREALTLHVEGMVEDGEVIPSPSEVTLDAARAEIPEADWIALGLVTVTVPTFPKTVNVPLSTDLVQEVDRLATNRRQFIMDATRRELDRLKKSA